MVPISGPSSTRPRVILFFLLVVLLAPVARAQDLPRPSFLAPSLGLIAGSSLDLIATLQALHTVPGTVEANPILAHGGTPGLVVGKVVMTASLVWALHQLATHGHPTAAKWIGWTSGIALTGLAAHNTQVGR